MYKKLTNNPFERSIKTYEYVYWNNAFSDEELKNVEEICNSEELGDSMILGTNSKKETEKIRKSKVNFFYKNDNTSWIFERFNGIISELNEYYYNFNLNGYESFQYTVYDSSVKGRYDWHMDTCLGNSIMSPGFESTETRKLTAIMLLNEPNVDFCGGDFQIYTGDNIEKAMTLELSKGKIICFPSFLIHRVKPVILGVRKSIVIWVTGPKFI